MVSVAVSKFDKMDLVLVQPGAKINIVYYCENILELDAGMWRYHANRMDAHRSQFDLGRVDAYI